MSEQLAGRSMGGVLHVKLMENDDIEAYLITFELIMEVYSIPNKQWTCYLAPQLSWKAQQSLSKEESQAYEAAILLHYGINEDACRWRFWAESRKDGETNRELAVRLVDIQNKWLMKHTSKWVILQHSFSGEKGLGCVTSHGKEREWSSVPATGSGCPDLAMEWEGQEVTEIVLDTGCKKIMVCQELMPPEIFEGDVATIRCAHDDTFLTYRWSQWDSNWGGCSGLYHITRRMFLLLGNTVTKQCAVTKDVMVVFTRAQNLKRLSGGKTRYCL